MSVTFSLFGYFVSFQLFKNLFVPIERLDGQVRSNSLDELVESDFQQNAKTEGNTFSP